MMNSMILSFILPASGNGTSCTAGRAGPRKDLKCPEGEVCTLGKNSLKDSLICKKCGEGGDKDVENDTNDPEDSNTTRTTRCLDLGWESHDPFYSVSTKSWEWAAYNTCAKIAKEGMCDYYEAKSCCPESCPSPEICPSGAFLSAVSAKENVWGDFTAANCQDREFADAGETKQCLNHVGGKWAINFITNWKPKTCAEYTDDTEEYCKKYPEFVACCGSLCRESTESLGCSANFGFNVETTDKIDDLDCESAEDTTCTDMNEELKTNLKTDTMLECKENKCVREI